MSTRIHAQIGGSRVDVVRLRDQTVRVARFSCGFFAVIAGYENQTLTCRVDCTAMKLAGPS